MRRVRVSVALEEEVRERLANEARAVPESLDAHLRRLLLRAAGIPEPELVEQLRQARAEAVARARELGAARRQIRELQARLNSLQAGSSSTAGRSLWSLDQGSRSADELLEWWRWLGAGVERLRERYQVVELGYWESGATVRWWWESPARVRAIAIAVAWEEALDRGGDSVPADPRYGEAFMEYLWRLSKRDLTLVPIGGYVRPRAGEPDHRWHELVETERAAFAGYLAEIAAATSPSE